MAEREAALAEQSLGFRAGDARAEDGFAGDLVEALQLVEPAQVQRDDGAEAAAVGSMPPTTLVPPPNGTTAICRCVQYRSTAATSSSEPGSQHGIGCVLGFGCLAPQQIQRGLAASAQQSGAVVVGEVRAADDGGQGSAVRRGQCRRAKPHVLETHRGHGGLGHAERLPQ